MRRVTEDNIDGSFGPPSGRRGRGRRGPAGFEGGFGGGGHRRHRRGGPGRRAKRGDMRAAALDLLSERPMHGYEIIQELESRSGGVWKPSPGSVYPTLQLLQDEGLVTASEIDGRRVFTLSEAGQAEVANRREQGAVPPWVELADDAGKPAQQLARAIKPILGATRQLFHDGTPAQQVAAADILTETRRRLYSLLAEDEASEAEGDTVATPPSDQA
jgi:DNA-binding PadR family transcriptional regulator